MRRRQRILAILVAVTMVLSVGASGVTAKHLSGGDTRGPAEGPITETVSTPSGGESVPAATPQSDVPPRFNVTLGDGRNRFLYDVTPVQDGYWAVGGVRRSQSDLDGWLLKLDEQGSVVTNRTFDLDRNTVATSVLPLDGGDVVVAATTTDGASSRNTPNGTADVARIDADGDGDVLWRASYGDDAGSSGIGYLVPTPDGQGVLAVGYENANDKGSGTATDTLVARVGLDGTAGELQRYDFSYAETVRDVAVVDDGVVTVHINSSSNDIQDYRAPTVAKFGFDGELRWRTGLPGDGFSLTAGVGVVDGTLYAVNGFSTTDAATLYEIGSGGEVRSQREFSVTGRTYTVDDVYAGPGDALTVVGRHNDTKRDTQFGSINVWEPFSATVDPGEGVTSVTNYSVPVSGLRGLDDNRLVRDGGGYVVATTGLFGILDTRVAAVGSGDGGQTLSVTQSADETTVAPGDTVSFTTEVTAPQGTNTLSLSVSLGNAVESATVESVSVTQGRETDRTVGPDSIQLSFEGVGDGATVTVKFSATVSGDASGTSTVTSTATAGGTSTSASTELSIQGCLADYTNESGVVTTDLLNDAIRDWARGEISTDTLRTLIQHWATGRPVSC